MSVLKPPTPRSHLFSLIALLATLAALASYARAADAPPDSGATTVLSIWPQAQMPGTRATQPENEIGLSSPTHGKKQLRRITNVSEPQMYVYLGAHASSPTPAIVICPGGAYHLLSIDLEGFAVAKWFQSHGVTAVVLKYRVPDNKAGALQDLERAMRLVCANKTAWNVDASRVGVLGFSAGGNLCARLLAESASSYAPIDATDQLGCRPDFAALIYPAYMGENNAVAADVAIHGAVPPLFIAQADDDTKYMPGTKIYEAALTSSKIPHVFIEFKTSGHGFGLGRGESAAWPESFLAYLEQSKILPAASPSHSN